MCFSPQTSFITFLIGIIFSLLLIYKGNKKYIKENIVFGITLIIVALVQLDEFFLWLDIDNKFNINKITTLISPFLIVGQPIFVYLLKIYFYHQNNILSFKNYNLPILILNIIYIIFFIGSYVNFYQNDIHTTGVKKGHLSWPWLKYFSHSFYLILLAINILYLSNFNYSVIFLIVSYFGLIISTIFFSYHIGELWCFYGAFVPLFMYFISSYL